MVSGDGVGGMAAVGTETVPSEWCQVVGWGYGSSGNRNCPFKVVSGDGVGGMAAVGTETVPSEWCQVIGLGVWQQWEQKPSLQSGVRWWGGCRWPQWEQKPSLQSGVR